MKVLSYDDTAIVSGGGTLTSTMEGVVCVSSVSLALLSDGTSLAVDLANGGVALGSCVIAANDLNEAIGDQPAPTATPYEWDDGLSCRVSDGFSVPGEYYN